MDRCVLLLVMASCFVLLYGKLAVPYEELLLQEPAFEVDSAPEPSESPISNSSVPLVMRILFGEADRVSNPEALPQGGDFHSLARSVLPLNIIQFGPHEVFVDFNSLEVDKQMWPGAEAWLVFQLRQSHMQNYNCSQELKIYKNGKKSNRPMVSVPLNYRTTDPLLAVKVTGSLASGYTVIIKDSTSYKRDRRLFSFANYIDCSLAWADEVLWLNTLHSPSPVLLFLSPELAAEKLLGSQAIGRHRREVHFSYETAPSEYSEEVFDRSQEMFFSCHLMEWVVNVQKLNWDWLIYPEQIPLNLCVGRCPGLLDRRFNATSHAVARGLYRLLLGENAKPENQAPCCVPVKYKRFTMLIERTPGVVSLETSSDLSAARCGCR